MRWPSKTLHLSAAALTAPRSLQQSEFVQPGTRSYPGSLPWKWNRGRWCRRRSQPRGAAPGPCRSWGSPPPFLSGGETQRGWVWTRLETHASSRPNPRTDRLTNLRWLERAFFKLLLQLCQRRIGYLLLRHNTRESYISNFNFNKEYKLPYFPHYRAPRRLQASQKNPQSALLSGATYIWMYGFSSIITASVVWFSVSHCVFLQGRSIVFLHDWFQIALHLFILFLRVRYCSVSPCVYFTRYNWGWEWTWTFWIKYDWRFIYFV